MVTQTVSAQPEVGFCEYFVEQDWGSLNDVFVVSEGGYVACGSGQRGWILRVDGECQEIWSRSYNQFERPCSIIECDNGDFLAGGGWGQADNVFGALRVRADGAQIWNRTYGDGKCSAVIELKSGLFVLAGFAIDQDQFASGYLVCIDNDGRIVWDNIYRFADGALSEVFNSMRETADGIVVVGGVNQLTWVLKVDFEGDVVWSRRLGEEGIYSCGSIVSRPDGFALAGTASDDPQDMWSRDFLLVLIDDAGQLESDHRYDFGANRRMNSGYSLTRLTQGGYILAGTDGMRHPRIQNAMYYKPTVICLEDDGELRWGVEYRLDNENGIQNYFTSVIVGEDSTVVMAGQVHGRQGDGNYEGVLMSLRGANPGGAIGGRHHFAFFRYHPTDLSFPVLRDDSVRFSCRARDNNRIEADYQWWINEAEAGTDTTILMVFEDYGEQVINCRITREDLARDLDWRVSVKHVYIAEATCDTAGGEASDSSEITVRRGQSVTFRLRARHAEDVNPEYRWILTDRTGENSIVGNDSVMTIEFPLAGEYRVEGEASLDGDTDVKSWRVNVRSLIWSWIPRVMNVTIPSDSALFFQIEPLEGMADSVTYRWTCNGQFLGRNDTLSMVFPDTGLFRVSGNISKGRTTERLLWNITVVPQPTDTLGVLEHQPPIDTRGISIMPNPVNSTSQIEFSLVNNCQIELDIIDLSGRVVSRIFKGDYNAGVHRMPWDSSGMPAGLYFTRLRAEGEISVGKMVITK